MKRIMFTLFAISVLCGSTFAADAKPMTKQGDKALLFTLGGLSNLSAGDFEGGLGLKYYFLKNVALRLGLGFSSSSQKFKNAAIPLPPTQLGESKYTATTFSVAPAVIYDFATSNSVAAYVGGQVYFATTSREQEGTTSANIPNANPSYNTGEKRTITTTDIAVGALVGVEWFAWENVSLGAEYGFGFLTNSGKTEVTAGGTTASTDSPTMTTISLTSINSGNLTLSVYF
jgi:opacity protein-like surface antigen